MAVYLVVLLSVLNSISQRGSKVAVSLYALELGAGSLMVGILAALFAAFPLLLAVHAGRVSDRFGMRYPIACGAATMALGLLAPAFGGGLGTLILCASLTGLGLFAFYLPVYGRAIGLAPSSIGMILSTYAVAGFLVRAFMHRLAERFTEVGVLTGSLFVAAAAYAAVPGLTDGVLLAAAAFALGLSLGSAQPLTIILTYNHAPKGRSGEALGMRIMANKVTQIAVPLVFGGLGALGAVPVFVSTGVFLLAGGVLSLRELRNQA